MLPPFQTALNNNPSLPYPVGDGALDVPSMAPSGRARRVKKICRWHIVGTDVLGCPKKAPSGRELAPKVTEGARDINIHLLPHPLAHRQRAPFYYLRVLTLRAAGSFHHSVVPVSLRLGHARAHTSPRDAALPPGGRLLQHRSSHCLNEAPGYCAKHNSCGRCPPRREAVTVPLASLS